MANHKRKRPKHRRAGCLLCKPHKDERASKKEQRQRPSVRRKLQDDEPGTRGSGQRGSK